MLEERLDNLKALSIQSDQKEKRRVRQATKRIANQLLESRKIKRRRRGAGAPSLLDEEDEDFIAKAIESKSTCHGRRHETTLFTHHRVKKSHFLSLANHFLSKRRKKLIKSAITVTKRGKPKNVKSLAAKVHRGKCPKTEANDIESTHHQRAHVRNAKFSMFAKGHEKHSVVISMDDKAYLTYVLILMLEQEIRKHALCMILWTP